LVRRGNLAFSSSFGIFFFRWMTRTLTKLPLLFVEIELASKAYGEASHNISGEFRYTNRIPWSIAPSAMLFSFPTHFLSYFHLPLPNHFHSTSKPISTLTLLTLGVQSAGEALEVA